MITEFDLKQETNDLIDRFEKSDYSTSVDILNWFYDAYDFYNIFESVELSTHLYQLLKSKGYKEAIDSKEELDCFNTIIKRKENNPEIIGYKLISLIMKNLKEHERLDNTLKYFIDVFNEKYSSSKVYNEMMTLLHNYINSEVVYIYTSKGEQQLKTGILDRVTDYKTVTIDGETIPFIGYQVAISKIATTSGITLYNNIRISSKYNEEDFSVIEKMNQELFGEEYTKNSTQNYL